MSLTMGVTDMGFIIGFVIGALIGLVFFELVLGDDKEGFL